MSYIIFSDIDEFEFFDKLGQELITQACDKRTERAFRCLGGNIKEFLTTLDGVHDVLKYQESGSDHESEAFICTASGDENLYLDFTTDKPAVAALLVGSLRAVARILYRIEADVTLNQSDYDQRHFRLV